MFLDQHPFIFAKDILSYSCIPEPTGMEIYSHELQLICNRLLHLISPVDPQRHPEPFRGAERQTGALCARLGLPWAAH